MKANITVLFLVLNLALIAGCKFPQSDNTLSVAAPLDEPSWIRDGEPIEYGGDKWYPTREIERFMDNEVYKAGEYRGVVFFLDKADVKPFERLYTRFAKGRYRAFERRE